MLAEASGQPAGLDYRGFFKVPIRLDAGGVRWVRPHRLTVLTDEES